MRNTQEVFDELKEVSAELMETIGYHAELQNKFDLAKHKIRATSYEEKAAGAKYTEEQIRTISIMGTSDTATHLATVSAKLESLRIAYEVLKLELSLTQTK